MWRASDPNNRRTEDVLIRDPPETCSQATRRRRRQVTSLLTSLHGRRHRRDAGGHSVIGSTNQLWPYSKIRVAVAVLNTANSGNESDPIEFETPEGGEFRISLAAFVRIRQTALRRS